jgi:hypothetical protein
MNVDEARQAARDWVAENGVLLPGFEGAFIHGSMNDLPGDAPLAPTSDVDVMVVLADPDSGLPDKPGKFRHHGALLEVSFLASEQVASAERVLGEYNLAGSFRSPGILADPTGHLTEVQRVVGENFARREWVRVRCAQAMEKVRSGFPIQESAPFYDQVVAWLFPAGILTHVVLVAGLRNPTVRKRYAAARELMAEYGLLVKYERLLEILGAADLSREQVQEHLESMTEAFDAAKSVIRTPFFFAADISDHARPVAVDGSQELIDHGLHREAVFWIVATYSRCMAVFDRDGTPALSARFDTGYRRLLADLGITTYADLPRRRVEVAEAVPWIGEIADTIIAANPEIRE